MIRVVEADKARSLRIPFAVFGDWGHRLDPKEAEACIAYLEAQGLPSPQSDVILAQCGAEIRGLERDGKIYIFAHSSEPAYLHHYFFHEYGHQFERRFLRNDLTGYFAVRGPVAMNPILHMNDKEVFAEDFVVLFGTDLAKEIPHHFRNYIGNALEAKREQLKEYVMSNIPKQGSVPETPVFRDIKGHWAEADIVEAAKAGLLRGDPDGRFRPDDKVTRAELAAVAARLLRRA